jgi:hypothetical protein
MFPPSRIVCLTEETVETLYLLGEQDRIVGISGYVVRPPQARREKPRVSAFTSANIDKILALKPDLVLTFSDLQADIAADLIRRGLNVHAFNQRSVDGILDTIRMLGAMIDANGRAEELLATLEAGLVQLHSKEVGFAMDSPLEGRVHCELVSEIRCRFPRSFRFCHPKKAVQADPVARPSEPSTRPCPRWGRTHHISPLEGGVRCELVSGGRADSAH